MFLPYSPVSYHSCGNPRISTGNDLQMVIVHSYVSSLEGKLPFADPHLKNLWTSQLFSSPLEFGIQYPKSRTLPLEPPEKALVEEPRCCFHVRNEWLTHFKSGSIGILKEHSPTLSSLPSVLCIQSPCCGRI